MASRKFSGFYTKHKTQKRKTFHDCVIVVSGNKVQVLSEDGTFLDSNYHGANSVKEDAEFETEKFLVEVGPEITSSQSPQPSSQPTPAPPPVKPRPTHLSRKRPRPSPLGEGSGVKPSLSTSHSNLSRKKTKKAPGDEVSPQDLQFAISEMLQHPIQLSGRRSFSEIQQELEKSRPDPQPTLPGVPPTAMLPLEGSRASIDTVRVSQPEPKKQVLKSFRSPMVGTGGVKSGGLTKPLRSTLGSSLQSPKLLNSLHFLMGKSILQLTEKDRVKIPDHFDSIQSYSGIFLQAIFEYANLQLVEVSSKLTSSLRRFSSSSGSVLCGHGLPAGIFTVKKAGANKGREFYSCTEKSSSCRFFAWCDEIDSKSQKDVPLNVRTLTQENLRLLWSSGIHIFAGCEYIPTSSRSQQHMKSAETFLKLPPDWNNKSIDMGVGDLWVLSESPNFDENNRSEFFLLAQGTSHGPARSGLLAIEPLTSMRRPMSNLYALHAVNLRSQFELIQMLQNLPTNGAPLLSTIVGASKPVHRGGIAMKKAPIQKKSNLECTLSWEEVQTIGEEIVERFGLNEDQIKVLWRCASWLAPPEEDLDLNGRRDRECVLVHGVFGSGKSYLLVALVIFLTTCAESDPALDKLRIFICAATNVAVDRLLESLLKEDFEDFIRVGSLKRISSKILPYSVSSSAGADRKNSDKEAIKDVKAMLRSKDITREEQEALQKELKALKEGKAAERLQRLKESRVVGATCAACNFSVLDDLEFPILFLDESGQLIEPISVVPIARFQCERLLCCGDPNQLPPTLKGLKEENLDTTLYKTLYSRLCNLGASPTMLRTQYRCHPVISGVANRLFYEGALRDGISDEDRPAILRPFPPIVLFDAENGKEVAETSGSLYNEFECQIVVRLLRLLTVLGANGEEIGVISLYSAQTNRIRNAIKNITEDDRSEGILEEIQKVKISTVDAFQGAERKYIILTTVRTTESGFMNSPNRVNVAFTRAMNQLFLVGHSATLRKDRMWKTILSIIQKNSNGVQSGALFLMNDLSGMVRDFFDK